VDAQGLTENQHTVDFNLNRKNQDALQRIERYLEDRIVGRPTGLRPADESKGTKAAQQVEEARPKHFDHAAPHGTENSPEG
jgi:hypothetical protein